MFPETPTLAPSAYDSDSDSSSDTFTLDVPSPPSSASGDCDCCSDPPSKPSPLITTIDPANFHSTIIIGAGPHALAVAARLRESRPAALFTDLEHARLSWLHTERERSRGKRITIKGKPKLVASRAAVPAPSDDLKVLDSSAAGWLGKWDGYFKGLGITHLRSPMFFHPCPADTDALVAFARREGRERDRKSVV